MKENDPMKEQAPSSKAESVPCDFERRAQRAVSPTPAEAAHAPVSPELSQRRVITMFAGLLAAMLVASLDQTIVSTALPTITGELGGIEHMLWVTTAYVLASTITMPLYGKLGDVMGRKGLFLGALVFFVAGSAICGATSSMAGLVVGRAVQGLGGGGLMILAQALVADVVPPRVRATYMGIMGTAFIVPTVAGPFLGGFFTDVVGWRWAFWINLPLGALAFAVAAVCLPKLPGTGASGKFDIAGSLTMVVALTSFVLATSLGGSTFAWGSPQIIGLIALTVVGAVAFVLVERRAAESIIPLYLFGNRNFVFATLGGMLAMVALMGAVSYLPTYFQIVHGLSATESGMMEFPALGASLVSSILIGVAVSKTGRYKLLMVVSFIGMGVGVALLSLIEPGTSLWFVGGYLFVLGLFEGMSTEILVLVAQNEFPVEVVGTATAANNFFREIGTTLGASIVGGMFTGRLAGTLASHLASLGGVAALGVDEGSLTPAIVRALPDNVRMAVEGAYNDALAPVFLAMVPMLVVGVVMMLLLKETPLAEKVADSGHMAGK